MNTQDQISTSDESTELPFEYPSYFVVQVMTGQENKYMKLAEPLMGQKNFELFWPRRTLRIRKKGRWRDTTAPIFPGYIFLEALGIGPDEYSALKRIPGFNRFLKSNNDIQRLPEAEARVLSNLMSFGEVVKKSTVEFDENQRIQIIDGPLKELQGRIVKVDRRKGRAKVKLDLYNESFMVDFGFDNLQVQTDKKES